MIISTSRGCFTPPFPASCEKSSWKQLYEKRTRGGRGRGKTIRKRTNSEEVGEEGEKVAAATEKVKGEERKEKGARKRARARKTLKSISASPRKIRYRESRSLRERERVPK